MAGNDLASVLGAPELAPPPPAPVAPAPVAAPASPALPNEPDASLLARAAVAEGDQNNPQSWRNIAGVVLNRAQKSGLSVADVLSQPGQFEAYQNGHIQGVDTSSPAYKAALAAVQGVKPGDVPYDSFYQPQIVAQRGVKPPFDPKSGTMIGTQLFGNGYAPPAQPQLANTLGLTPEEQAALAPYTGPAAQSPDASTAPKTAHVTFGPNFAPVSAAADATFAKIDQERGLDTARPQGDPKFPYYIPPGQVAPETAGIHWVDVNGVEHVNPGGAAQNALAGIKGFAQGIGPDVAASLSRLTSGGISAAGTDPMQTALGAMQGGVSAQDMAAATQQGVAQQQRDYAFAHHGDPFAQTGRFLGQAIPGAALSAAVPELEAPAALGLGGRLLAGGATNALRGVAAAVPSVGANPAPVAQQLGTAAAVGVAAPLVAKAAGAPVAAVTGVGRTVAPEVASLADTAKTKYGIDLASGQVMGANGDRGAATAYSTMLGSSPEVRAQNALQRQQWQKGVTATYGDPSGNIAPEALSANRARIGQVMNDVAGRSNIAPPAADAVQTRIGQIIGDAQKVLPDNEVKPLLNMAQAIGDVRDPATGIPGEAYQNLTRTGAPLDRLESSDNSNVAHYASQIHDALNDGLAASSSPQDVDALRQARWQYKNLMTVAKAAQNQNNVGLDGVLTPNSLNTATTSNFKGRAFQGAADLDELNAIRNKFMTEPPNSFTSNRAHDLMQSGLAGLATGGAVDIGLGLLHQPETAIPTGLSALAGTGAKLAAEALKRNKVAGSAANIIARSNPNAPGSALTGIGGAIGHAAKAMEIPLSALAGVRLGNAIGGPVGSAFPGVSRPQPVVGP